MKTPLFDDFDKVSAKQWKQKIQVDLNGKDYNDTLVWESLESIKVKPFYSEDDIVEGAKFQIPENHSWSIAESIIIADEKTANLLALEALEKGTESLMFTISNPHISWERLFEGIVLENVSLYFDFQFLEVTGITPLLEFFRNKKIPVFLNIDLLGNLARTGNWFHNQKEDHRLLEEIISLCKEHPHVGVLAIDTSLYQNAGANSVQQLAYALAHANEYLNHANTIALTALGNETAKKLSSVVFKVAVGNNYFFEIAKMRALRWLWRSLVDEYGFENDCHIVAFPSKRNKTIYDYNVNQLRTTTECMAAILGGVDTICNIPYDGLYKNTNVFSSRIARNQLLVLKNESYFTETVHAANGSYYIETLTEQLAEKALRLFKQIEKGGGFLALLKEGTIQRKIRESAKKEQQLFNSGAFNLVGANKYQNQEDLMGDNLEVRPFLKKEKRKTTIEPIIEKRLAEKMERERLSKEGR